MPKIIADEQIYHAAITVVIERGYSGATTKQIAEAAGVGEVTLFRKYGSKAELIRQAIESMIEQTDYKTGTQFTGDVHADLIRVVKMYQGSAEKQGRFIYTIMLEILRNPELAEIVASPMSMMSKIAKLLTQYQIEGILRQEHPMHSVAGLLGPLITINLLNNAYQETEIPKLDLGKHVEAFLSNRLQH